MSNTRRHKHRVVVEITTDEPQTAKQAVRMVKDIIDTAWRCTALSQHRPFGRRLQKTQVKEFNKVMHWERYKFWKGLRRNLFG